MSFFKQFPKTILNVNNENKSVVDFFRHVDVNDAIASDLTTYTKITVGDGERPDNLSQRLYGTPDYYWTFFILNESLKKGLDDWPRASSTIETEFTREYDNLSVLSFQPYMASNIVSATQETDTTGLTRTLPYQNVRNSFSGLDLTYEDIKVYRNFETASVVKWDNKRQQLFLKDFTNRSNFLMDPTDEDNMNKLTSVFMRVPPGQGITETNWQPEVFNGRVDLTFNDWPIIGQNKENGQSFDYLSTITNARLSWLEHLFEWFESNLVNKGIITGTTAVASPLTIYQQKKNALSDKTAAFEVFKDYFSFIPLYQIGRSKFAGFVPYRRADGGEHTFSSARNAPFCYYASNDFSEENKINAYDALKTTDDENAYDPMNFESYYQYEIRTNIEKSQIKAVAPEYINSFVDAYREKLNAGVTVTGNRGSTTSRLGGSGGGSVGSASSGGGTSVSGGGAASAGGSTGSYSY
jgi:uncharacterized membrane protein YgcG